MDAHIRSLRLRVGRSDIREARVLEEGAEGAGLLVGLLTVAVLARAVERLLFDVEPTDPVIYGSVGLMLLGASAVAAYHPARKAARIAPAEVLDGAD